MRMERPVKTSAITMDNEVILVKYIQYPILYVHVVNYHCHGMPGGGFSSRNRGLRYKAKQW